MIEFIFYIIQDHRVRLEDVTAFDNFMSVRDENGQMKVVPVGKRSKKDLL